MKIDLSGILSNIYYLGTIETHIVFLIASNTLLVTSRSSSRFQRFLKKSIACYLLIFFGFSVLYRPFVSSNIFRSTGLTRSTLSKGDIENMLGDLEDRSFDDKDAQEYIQSLEEKLLGEKSQYYLRGEDLFGDKFQGLSFEGRISTQKKMVEWKLYAEFLILIYSTLAMFPPKVSKFLKMLALLVGAGLGYISWIISESESVDRHQSADLQKLFFSSSFMGIKFDQFCIFNLVDLLKGVASCISMVLVFISHSGYTDTTDQIQSKLRSIVEGKSQVAYEEELKKFSDLELANLVESRQSANKKNQKFILLMMLVIGGLAAFNKYELIKDHFEKQSRAGKYSESHDFNFDQ